MTIRLPLRILAWVVAFVLGAFVVRQLAKWTGFVGGDTFVDLMLGWNFSIYLRLALLVPVWALFATLFATGFLEAPGWWHRRGAAAGAPAASASADRPAPQSRARTTPSSRPAPAEDRERLDPLPPSRRVVPRAAPAPAASEVAEPAVGQRPRRIPRRDTGS